jgi:outer membrane lipoprotein LolB
LSLKSLVALSLALWLGACTNLPPASSLAARPAANEISTFAFSGRIAVRQGEQRHHVKIDWRHTAANDEILLTTPLGQGIAELMRDARGARLELADRRSYAAADWSDLSAEVFGFRLPLSGALRWLLGDLSDTGEWQVRIEERESEAPNALPTVIELERGDIGVRVKIDEWSEVQ